MSVGYYMDIYSGQPVPVAYPHLLEHHGRHISPFIQSGAASAAVQVLGQGLGEARLEYPVGLMVSPFNHDHYTDAMTFRCPSRMMPEYRQILPTTVLGEGQESAHYEEHMYSNAWQCQADNYSQLSQRHEGMGERFGAIIPQEYGNVFCL